MRIYRKLFITCALLFLTPVIALGQGADQCANLFTRSLNQLGRNCTSVGQGQICYVSGDIVGQLIDTTASSEGPQLLDIGEDFDEPGDVLSLANPDGNGNFLYSVDTSGFLQDEQEYGLSAAFTQASLHPSQSRNGLALLEVGDLLVVNGTMPEHVYTYNGTVPVTIQNATLYTYPSNYVVDHSIDLTFTRPNEIITVASGSQTFDADGVSPDGNWVRVHYESETDFGTRPFAWVLAEQIDESVDLSSLPEIGPNSYPPYSRIFIEEQSIQECEEAPPSGLLVQGPPGVETDFYINGLIVRLASTAYFERQPGSLRITTLSGFSIVNPDSPEHQVILPPGFTASFCLAMEEHPVWGELNYAVWDSCNVVPSISQNLNLYRLFNRLPSRFFAPIDVPSLIRPSGVGNPPPRVIIPNPNARARLQALCDAGRLPDFICEAISL